VDKELLKRHISVLPKEQLIELFISKLKGEELVPKIPLSAFKAPLSSLELIVKYMKEDLGYSNKKIALILNRSSQNIWITYRNALAKHPMRLPVERSEHDIPIDIFTDTRLSVLESIVLFLRKTLTNEEIAQRINRDKTTIATVKHRGMRKI
jgi:DNA-binding NarL/FixJ family response regulator